MKTALNTKSPAHLRGRPGCAPAADCELAVSIDMLKILASKSKGQARVGDVTTLCIDRDQPAIARTTNEMQTFKSFV